MPILTHGELSQYLPADIAQLLWRDPGGFAATERATAAEIVTLTGITEPAEGAEATAPVWAKESAAYLILYKRLGTLGKLDPELRQWAADMATQARRTLANNRLGTSAGRATGATTGAMEGFSIW